MSRNAHKANHPIGPTLDEATFQALRWRITAASGLYILSDENSRYLLERRLAPRLRLRGLASYAEYEAALDEPELDALLDVIAVHETYFFREQRQLDVFARRIIPELARHAQPVNIWSAGCSTGEEAYTIAMLLAEDGLLNDGHAQILASDLSNRVIASGQRAVYGAASFRTTEARFQAKYFLEAGRGLWRASERLRAAVHFEQGNLIGLNAATLRDGLFDTQLTPRQRRGLNAATLRDGPAGVGEFDVIFCRNVLMHFDDAAAKQTLRAIHSRLRAGGYLLVGHAESLLPLGLDFTAAQFDRELVHRK